MNNIIIVSEGKEIAFAKALSDLFRIQIDNREFLSSLGRECYVELYSKQTFLHSNISQKAYKIIVGTATIDTPEMDHTYDKDGMHCYVGDQYARLFVDEKTVDLKCDSVYQELQQLEREYFKIEKEYTELTNKKKTQNTVPVKSLFAKKNCEAVVFRAYICLAYHFYLNEINAFLKLNHC